MNPCKTFTDFLGGIAAAIASLSWFREFMLFSPVQDLSLIEKLALFLKGPPYDYLGYAILAILFAVSVIVGRLLRRFPALHFPVSLLPFLFALSCYRADLFSVHPMLYLVLGALHAAGPVADAILQDRADGRQRGFAVANLASLATVALCGLIWQRADTVRALAEIPSEERTLFYFDEMICAYPDFSLEPWLCLAILSAVPILISLLFRGAFWIDLILSLVPLGFSLWQLLVSPLAPHIELAVALSLTVFLCRLSVMLFSPPWRSRRERAALT